MRSASSHLPPGIDHPEERLHHLTVDNSLYEAICHRLQSVEDFFATVPPDDQIRGLRGRLESVISQLRTYKTRVDRYYESGPFDQVTHQRIHDHALAIADQAEELSQSLEHHPKPAAVCAAVTTRLPSLESVLAEALNKLSQTP